MKSSGIARKIQRNFEDYGWWIASKKSLVYLISPVYEHQVYRIYRINLSASDSQDEIKTGDFIYKVLDTTDDHVLDQIDRLAEFLKGELRGRIAAGDLCLAALYQNNLAGFNLITCDEVFIPLIKLKRSLKKEEAWSVHIATHKDFRRRGLASQIRYRVYEELRKRGFKRLYGGALRSNVASLKLARRVGFREIVDVHFTSVLSYKTWRYKRVC